MGYARSFLLIVLFLSVIASVLAHGVDTYDEEHPGNQLLNLTLAVSFLIGAVYSARYHPLAGSALPP